MVQFVSKGFRHLSQHCVDVLLGLPLTDAWKAALLDTRKPDCIGIIWPEMTFDADWPIEELM